MWVGMSKDFNIQYGNSLDLVKNIPDNTFDSIITDPPYEINFINKGWDRSGIAYNTEFWSECLRTLKPGGHLLSFSASRTYHRIAVAIEEAGFEVKDSLHWIYGSGFPKSVNLGTRFEDGSDLQQQWDGWGTCLKPAHEPIVLARKPFKGPIYKNVEKWGVGAFNIEATRVGDEEIKIQVYNNFGGFADRDRVEDIKPEDKYVTGRFPSNVLFSHSVNCTETQCEDGCGVKIVENQYPGASDFFYDAIWDKINDIPPFIYGAKASKSEKNASGMTNNHPTVKPIDLMRYLIRLVTPPEGHVFDPFLGSGTTAVAAILENCNVTGFELTDEYWDIIESRIEWAKNV